MMLVLLRDANMAPALGIVNLSSAAVDNLVRFGNPYQNAAGALDARCLEHS